MAIFSLHDELFFHKRKFLIQLFSTQKIAILDNEISIFYLKEAKSSCAGQWYLPAGRMDPGEDVFEAAKREVFWRNWNSLWAIHIAFSWDSRLTHSFI